MKYLDEFRNPDTAQRLVAEIRRTASRRWTLMEVCGGQTHSLLRHGIDAELQDVVELIHGPGCPVCVTAAETIELAQSLSQRPNTMLVTFNDMLRVPGVHRSLADVRAAGGNVRPVYSPIEAVQLARCNPNVEIVFFAVGFETTAPATALAVRQASALGLANFSLLVAHVRVLPAMQLIAGSADCRVHGFLAAGHVCTVTGCEDYQPFVEQFDMPVVITGFEPVDLLQGILGCVRQLEAGQRAVANCYTRTARAQGNPTAWNLVTEVFEPGDQAWRGLGVIARGGLKLQARWKQFDAEVKFGLLPSSTGEATICPSGDVMAGRMKPTACPHFGTACTPDHPLGAPMVSSEGACAAYFRYSRPVEISSC